MAETKPTTEKILKRAKELQKSKGLSPLIAEASAGVEAYLEASKAGEALEGLCTIKTYRVNVQSKTYGPGQVRLVRSKFNASQALFAKFLGVTPLVVSLWERGDRKPSRTICRYLDDLQKFPQLWTSRIQAKKPVANKNAPAPRKAKKLQEA
jgi:DNA-binding transcriptional regulator YiaG